MCFITTKEAMPLKATENIVCWKYINTDNTNAFSNYLRFYEGVITKVIYTPNVKMPRIKINKKITEGVFRTSYTIDKGYHSFIVHPQYIDSSWCLDDPEKTKIAKFIIPKGTMYYENKEDGQYVSETIMLVED